MAIHDNDKQLFFAAPSDSQDVPDNFLGTVEQTYQESSYVASTISKPWNYDDIFRKTGDYSVYDKMANDDQVSVCIDLLCDLVVGTGWELMCEEEEGQEIADDCYKILEQGMDISFDEYIEEVVKNSSKYGFALSEKVFKISNDGAIGLKSLKTRHPGSWLIYTDEFGNVEKYVQHGPNGDVEIEPKALMHAINRREHDNPYGTSDLRKAYDAWFVKQHIIRYYAIFLEKAAGPMPHAKYDKNLPTDKINDLFNIVKNFATKTALVTPDSIQVDFLESKNNGDVYIKGINLFNMLIGRALFIPDLTGLQGSETGGGSYALGTTQIDLFFKHISKRRRVLERMINKQIIEPMVIWNHGEQEYYPKFQFKSITEDHSVEYAKTFIEAIKGKLYKPNENEINHLRSLIKFPEGDVEFVEEPVAAPLGPDGLPVDQKLGPDGKPLPPEEQPKPEEKPKEEVKEEKTFKKKLYDHNVGSYYKRVDFNLMEQQLESGVKELIGEIEPVATEAIRDLLDQVKRKNILGSNAKPEKIDSLKLRLMGKMNTIIKKKLNEHYNQSKVEARRELAPNKKEFAAPIPTDKFKDFIAQDIYQYLGDYEYAITKEMRLRLMNAIRDGTPLSSVMNDAEKELMGLSEVSIERYARTKHTEVMNRARLEEFEDSKVVAAYQYSAIMDDRTSDICAELHEKIFEKGTEVVPPCFTGDTKVLTASGWKRIDCISTVDYVWTHENRFKRVEKVHCTPKESGRLFQIGEAMATANHPYLTRSGEFVEAQCLAQGEGVRSIPSYLRRLWQAALGSKLFQRPSLLLNALSYRAIVSSSKRVEPSTLSWYEKIKGWIHIQASAWASLCQLPKLCLGTSTGGGETSWSVSFARRNSTSQELQEIGQPNRKSTGIVSSRAHESSFRTTEIKEQINVYNLDVEDDHTYVAGEYVVHNCHFNCRSTLIPITIFEEYKADNSAKLDKFIDEALDKSGFSRK